MDVVEDALGELHSCRGMKIDKIVKIFFDIFVTNAILIEQDKLSIYRQKSVL